MINIFIVEDEAFVALDLRQTLTQLGYKVVGSAASGEQAIHQIIQLKPDLVLIDIMLSGELDGVDVALEVRQLYQRPIVFLTAYSDMKTVERMKQVQSVGYIRKPYDEEVLRVTIELALYKYETERQLLHSEQRLLTTLRSIGDGVITTDASGRVEFINRVAENLTGWKQEEARGKPFTQVFDILNEQSRQPAFNPISRVLEEGIVLGLANHTVVVSRDGRETPIDDSAAPIVSDDGEIMGAVIVFRDITTRRETEMILRQSQRLDGIGVLAGGVAHDFNNILTGVLAQSSLLLAKLPENSWEAKRVRKIVVSAERAADLTRQLLNYAGKGISETTTIDLNQFLQENDSFVRSILPGDLAISYDLADESVTIEGDESQVRQVVINLITNAWEAINSADGKVGLRTSVIDLNELEVEQYLSRDPLSVGRYALLEISDNGIGMDAATRERIFEPFYSTKTGGTGLGLAALLGIIYRHDGGIAIESQVNVGTKFKIVLPYIAQATQPTQNEILRDPETATELTAATLLVVDDQHSVTETVEDILEKTPLTVMVVNSGVEAIQLFKEKAAAIDLVLLDIQMPNMGGLAVLKAIKAIRPDIRVILSSGYSPDNNVLDVMSDTVQFLSKPYRYNHLVAAIQKMLGS